MYMRMPELEDVVSQAKCIAAPVLLEHSKGLINVHN